MTDENLTLDKSLNITDEVGEIGNEDTQYKPKVRKLVIWPDARLNRACATVETFDEELHKLSADMFATMKHFQGVGIAAPQIGVMKRVIALWIERENPMIFVNPRIIESSDRDFEWEEGCLSVPGYYAKRKRPDAIAIAFQDVNGVEHELELRDIYAFAFQHELDHIEGKTFVDNLSALKKVMVQKKITKAIRQGQVNVPAVDETIEPEVETPEGVNIQ